MRILGIESSCDDTSVALLDSSDQGHFIIAEKTFSQIEIHQKYGGVVPEIAGRMHAEKIAPIIEEVLKDQPKPDVIAVTAGPGLITGLIVAVEAARTLGYAWNIPIVATNHISGHVHSVEIQNEKTVTPPLPIAFPALALIVSGGHTELILMQSHTECTILGRTKDDAAGECFDKVASLLGFAYPGGPHISREAVNGNSNAIEFPRPMIHDKSYDFSFSGLKTLPSIGSVTTA
jgi:N6-L-threonylcarbamoyladenine synthase